MVANDTAQRRNSMIDTCTYQVEISGRIDEEDLKSMCPPQVNMIRVEPTGICFSIFTDQSGLIGLLRHLHGRGVVLDSVVRSLPQDGEGSLPSGRGG